MLKCVQLPKDEGIGPKKLFASRASRVKFLMFPISFGILPPSRVSWKRRFLIPMRPLWGLSDSSGNNRGSNIPIKLKNLSQIGNGKRQSAIEKVGGKIKELEL
ncbi:hypothetical protein GmHk_12G033571 [Glycine max]|nr:hypothetical protein GmHk_12G033571 [Glycine max]